jgi:phage tail-like protein
MKQNEIKNLLPGIFQRTIHPETPLVAIIEVMECLHAPSEEILAQLEAFFDPYRTPDRFVPYLARWVDMARFLAKDAENASSTAPPSFPSGLGRLRELIVAAAYLSKWRGTLRGMALFLETATGARGFEIYERVPGKDGQTKPFHILVRAPAETEPYRDLVEQIIQMEKPAYVTHEVEFV